LLGQLSPDCRAKSVRQEKPVCLTAHQIVVSSNERRSHQVALGGSKHAQWERLSIPQLGTTLEEYEIELRSWPIAD
jgi:hypothetical protein